jgi:uncharacterized protein YoxC
MSILVNILIIFFIYLLFHQILLAYNFNINIVEGLETQYQGYDPSNILILAQQNAGNISYLKERLDKLDDLYEEVQDISGNVVSLQTQLNNIAQAQQDYTTQMTGGTAPVITGT